MMGVESSDAHQSFDALLLANGQWGVMPSYNNEGSSGAAQIAHSVPTFRQRTYYLEFNPRRLSFPLELAFS